MSWRTAPSALRRPISRVRSVTETSMMFMTPTPPTSSAIEAISTMVAEMPSVTARRFPISMSGVMMPKSLGWSKRRPRRWRRMLVPSSIT